MIIELGKVTEETQEITQPIGLADDLHYQYLGG